MKKFILTTLFGAALVLPSGAVTWLGLGIDGSGSISSGDFDLQKQGYVNALGNLPTDGSVGVGVWQFSSSIIEEFAVTLIDSVADRDLLVAAVNGMTQINLQTDIAGTIWTARNALLGVGDQTDKRIIDISTDGVQVGGGPSPSDDPATEATAAVAAGIDQVNGLGVGPGAVIDFEAGVGSFEVLVNDFADFETAIETKIKRETGTPDGGSTILLLGSVLTLGFFAKRKAK